MPELNEGGHCLAIECTPEMMEEARAAVVDGYHRLVRGGLEVGGLLLGRRDGETLLVAASRPIPCEYAYGPTFALSSGDLAGLAKLLEASSSEPELKGLVPVGWYHSHTRGNLELSERDLQIHNRWFPKTWQLALVLRPEWKQPTRAAFYVRDAQGVLRQEPEFVVEPRTGVRRIIHATPAAPRVEPPPEAPAPPEPAAAPPAPAPAAEPPPIVELPLPSFTQSPGRAPGPSRGWWALFAVACSIAVVSSAIALRGYWFPKPPAELQVALQDMGGQLAIQWNKEAPAIQEAESGVLEIQDGDRKRVLKLSGPEIRGASVVVSRQSGRVAVRLEAKLPRGRATEGRARFEGEPIQRTDVEQLQKDLSTEQQRNRDLKAAIAALQKRLAGKP